MKFTSGDKLRYCKLFFKASPNVRSCPYLIIYFDKTIFELYLKYSNCRRRIVLLTAKNVLPYNLFKEMVIFSDDTIITFDRPEPVGYQQWSASVA